MTRELRIFSTIAVQSALEALVPRFEAESGCRLGITWNTAPALVKRLQAGETADVLILNRAGIDTMIGDGRVLRGLRGRAGEFRHRHRDQGGRRLGPTSRRRRL